MLNYLIRILPYALPLYVVRFTIGGLPTTLLEIFILALIASWLYQKKEKGILTTAKNTWNELGNWKTPIIAWLIATLIAVFIAQDKIGAFGHWRAFILEPILIFIILQDVLQSKKRDHCITTLLNSIAGITILMGLYAILQYLTGWGIPHPWNAWPGRRATGIFGFPNGLSLFMVPFGVLCWSVWFNGNKKIRFIGATVLALLATILAQSIGGILAFGGAVLFTLLVKTQTRKIGIALTGIGLIGASIIGWNIAQQSLAPEAIETSLASTKKWSATVRTVIWKESLDLALEHPLLGSGLRSYKTAIVPFHQAEWMEIFPHPHNIFLMLWIETGILGLLAFCWILYTWLRLLGKREERREKSLLKETFPFSLALAIPSSLYIAPLIAILLHGLVDMPYFKNDLAVQFWILIALTITLITYEKNTPSA